MGHVVVSVDLLEAAILVTEVATLAIWAELVTVKLPTVLAFILVIGTLLLLAKIKLVLVRKFFLAVRILALIAPTTGLCDPVPAQFSLVHRSLRERL